MRSIKPGSWVGDNPYLFKALLFRPVSGRGGCLWAGLRQIDILIGEIETKPMLTANHRVEPLLEAVGEKSRVIVIDGADADGPLDKLTESFCSQLRDVERIRVRELTVETCTGCWSCWVETPGRCRQKDDVAKVLSAIVKADLVVFALPLRRGFVCAACKHLIDRLIPLGLPDIELVHGECMHRPRYAKQAALAAILEPTLADNATDVALNEAYVRRLAAHGHHEVLFVASTSASGREQ
jgi:hypothetical protein